MDRIKMKLLTLIPLLLLSRAVMAECSVSTMNNGHLQWSEPATITSPNHKWQVEVHPILTSDYNQTPVSLRNCDTNKASKIFTLERSAELFWDPNSKYFLVINKPNSDDYRLLIFHVSNLSKHNHIHHPSALDDSIKKLIDNHLGKNKRIRFYLPSYVSWKNEKIAIAVGGTALPAGDGPMSPYCYGAVIDADKENVTTFLSKDDFKRKFKNAACQIYP